MPNSLHSIYSSMITKRSIDETGGGVAFRQDPSIFYLPSERVFRQNYVNQPLVVHNKNNIQPDIICKNVTLPFDTINADVIIHSHSTNSVVVSEWCVGQTISWNGYHGLKGIRSAANGTAIMPILEDANNLNMDIRRLQGDFKELTAVLIRKHGFFVWGASTDQTYIEYEALENMFDISVKHGPAKFQP